MTITDDCVSATMDMRAARHRRLRRRMVVLSLLALAVISVFCASLMIGNTFYGPAEVWGVIRGEDVAGASFAVGELRLPRATLAVIAGASFAIAGVTFQTLLRNPLASPDIIGIDAGAATAAVAGIVIWSLGDSLISVVALLAAVATAGSIYLLAHRDGFSGTRLVLIGIGVAAFLDAITAYLLSKAAEWDIQTALHWLVGSLNGATWSQVVPVAAAFCIIAPLLLMRGRDLGAVRLGDDKAASLGVNVQATRLLLILGAVALLAFATAACGPIAFVAFMSGPVAARLVGTGGPLLIPAALVGALLVISADLVGANALGNRMPVGVVTGALGAPFLLFLLARMNRSGGMS